MSKRVTAAVKAIGNIPLPVSDTQLDGIGGSLEGIEEALGDIQTTRNGEQLNKTYDIEQHEIQKGILQELKLIRMIIGEAFNNSITQEDI